MENTKESEIKNQSIDLIKDLKITLQSSKWNFNIKEGSTLEGQDAYNFLKKLIKVDHDYHFSRDPKINHHYEVAFNIQYKEFINQDCKLNIGDFSIKGETVSEVLNQKLRKDLLNSDNWNLETLNKVYPDRNWNSLKDVDSKFLDMNLQIFDMTLKVCELKDENLEKIKFEQTPQTWNVKITSTPKLVDTFTGKNNLTRKLYEFNAIAPDNKEICIKKWAYENESKKLVKDAELKITGFNVKEEESIMAIDAIKEKMPSPKLDLEELIAKSEAKEKERQEKEKEAKIYIRANYNNKDIVKALAGALYLAPIKMWIVPKKALLNAPEELLKMQMYKTKGDIFNKKEISIEDKKALISQKASITKKHVSKL